ncbi:MAG: DUF4382 domain-containing protein [Leptolyngbya sp. SIO1E4]|nr:DUF4382 domain-containing protein [Leptolyngbya sp. SIO1E4]
MLSHAFLPRLALGVALPALLVGCGSGTTTSETPEPSAEGLEDADATEEDATIAVDAEAVGALEIRANGEDFVRQGFVTKDGWQVDFDHVYVTLSEVTAYQSEPPFDAEAGEEPEALTVVSIEEPITVDLAAGDDTAEPILVETLAAPAGHYNALSWQMTPAATGAAAGYPLMIQGQAAKAGETIDFTLKVDPTLTFVCGDYVGDDRKGVLTANETADLEATFHFDHLFGDGEAPAEDAINTGALGFDPLAALAEGGTLDVNTEQLEAQLAPEDYALLLDILPSLGHVGEGHCKETELTSR